MKTQSESPLFQLYVFQEIQTRKFPPPFKREKVRQSSYSLSKIPLRILADWETNINAEAVLKYAQQPLPDWGRWAENTAFEFEENCWERQLK